MKQFWEKNVHIFVAVSLSLSLCSFSFLLRVPFVSLLNAIWVCFFFVFIWLVMFGFALPLGAFKVRLSLAAFEIKARLHPDKTLENTRTISKEIAARLWQKMKSQNGKWETLKWDFVAALFRLLRLKEATRHETSKLKQKDKV